MASPATCEEQGALFLAEQIEARRRGAAPVQSAERAEARLHCQRLDGFYGR